MRNSPHRAIPHATNTYLVRTAYHMADAVSFLIRVARDAGMRAVAFKLATVRADLLNLATREDEGDGNGVESEDGSRAGTDKPH